ncbi:MAG: ABC transporter substrate-binding protein [Acidimicrobiales bacterium]
MSRRTVAGLLVALLLAACGTRLPDEAFVAADGQSAAPGDAGPDGTDDTADSISSTTTTVAGSDGGSETGGTDGATTGGSTGGTTGAGTDGGAPSGPNQASDIGITATTITLGTIVAENGVLGDAFAPAARGLRAWTQAINAKGGINGRTVVLKTCDDREDRSRSLECARRLVEQDKVFALVATNTRAMGGAAQYLNDKGVPVIGIPITNSFSRYPHFWSGYPNSYPKDGKQAGYNGDLVYTTGNARWFKAALGVDKAAVFQYDIDESRQAGEAFKEGLELEGFRVTAYTVSFAAPSFDQAVADMQRQGTQIIFDTMDDGANRKLCDAMARRQFTVKAKVSTVVSFGDSVGNDYNDTCRNSVYIPGDSIPYTKTSVPAVAEFRQAYARYQPGQELHQWALEAWGQATLVADAVRAMGATPTRKGLEDYFRALDRYTANGLFTGLDWQQRAEPGAKTAEDCFSIARWLDSEDGWVEATDRFPYCYPDAKQFTSPALEQGN